MTTEQSAPPSPGTPGPPETSSTSRTSSTSWGLVALGVLAVGGIIAFVAGGGLEWVATRYAAALEAGAWGPALGFTFLTGLGTALTPCVYPMIAITVSIFGASKGVSRLRAMTVSTAYVLGIAALMTPLGVASAMAGTLFGAWTGNPWVMFPLAIFFLLMAFSMFGGFDMSLPTSLQTRLTQMGGVGVRGAFVMGLVSGLIAAPCAGPVVSGLLGYISTTRDVGFGAASMFVYSLGLGTLFWVVGTFAVSLPKTGRWVETVKSVFGVVMLVMAIYFVRNMVGLPRLLVRDQMWAGVSVGLMAAGLLAGGIHLAFKGTSAIERARKLVGVLLITAGVLGVTRYLEALPPGAQITWLDDYSAARSLASSSAKPLLVDFGADWCGACRELDHNALSDPAVVHEAQRFVSVRVDLSDAGDAEAQSILAGYEQQGLPLVVMHHADGTESSRVTSVVTAEDFLGLLSAVR